MTQDVASTLTPDTAKRLRDWLDGIPAARAAAYAAVSVAMAEEALTGVGLLKAERVADDRAETPRRLYLDERLPAREVAARLGLTEDQVWSRLRRAGIHRSRTPQAVTDQKVRVLYEEGLSIRAIAAELGIHQRNVWRHLGRAGVERRPHGTAGVVLSRRALERLYLHERLALAEVARSFDVSPAVVARNLDRYGIARHRPPLERTRLEELYLQERLGLRAIAARLGVSEREVRAGLAHHGIPVRRPGRPATG